LPLQIHKQGRSDLSYLLLTLLCEAGIGNFLKLNAIKQGQGGLRTQVIGNDGLLLPDWAG
jgi:hypothetical protein